MHFSKQLSELLLTLPPELAENAIEYRKLKRLIHDVVDELESLGLSPDVLQRLLQKESSQRSLPDEEAQDNKQSTSFAANTNDKPSTPQVIYEFSPESKEIEPRLRFRIPRGASGFVNESITSLTSSESQHSEERNVAIEDEVQGQDMAQRQSHTPLLNRPTPLLYSFQRGTISEPSSEISDTSARSLVPCKCEHSAEPGWTQMAIQPLAAHSQSGEEVVVPLLRDEEFYRLLFTALQSLASYFDSVHDNFIAALRSLAVDISQVARPLSSTSSFHPHSNATDPAAISTSLFFRSPALKSDLSVWREIFQLYVESEIFESLNERTHGERSIQDAEARLKAFSDRVTSRGLGDRRTLKFEDSRAALASFLRLNILLMNIKKFQYYNAEAMRKILKKHAKRTRLPLPLMSESQQADRVTFVVPPVLHSLPHTLVQAVGEVLLPVIPHIDDYSCAICTSIAFKPIRLSCGHLFCVRCLVKMQKRGQDNCPMCRAPTVVIADRSNVDWALLNFLQDWFPQESYAKLRANEREAAEEQMAELGLESSSCVIS